jgi:hypothetical protein
MRTAEKPLNGFRLSCFCLCLTAKIDTKVTARRFKGIGQLFGLSHSAVSHAVKSLKARMLENQELTAKFNDLYSQFKL